MRKRNAKYVENVGGLVEEIENQELENVNGGNNTVNISNMTIITLHTVKNCPTVPDTRGIICEQNPRLSFKIRCGL